ncbi:MFS transporter [Pseudoneobacillus sp. C159]
MKNNEFRNLLLYSAGKTVSVFGASMYNFAVGLYVLKITGSALSFAVTLLLGILPMILINPFAGVIADKVNKKKLVVGMDFLSGVLLVAVYFLSREYGLSLWLIYCTTFLLTLCATFFGVAMESAKPNIVSAKRLMNLNSISKIIDSVSLIMGPMIGGVAFALFDIRTFIVWNGVGFILSGCSLLFIQINRLDLLKDAAKIHFFQDMKEGFRYIMERDSLKSIYSILISLNFFIGFSVTIPLPYIVNNVLELSTKQYGLIQSFFPAGMIFGALVVKRMTEKMAYSVLLKRISYILSMLMVVFGLPVLIGGFEKAFYVVFFSVLMLCYGIVIALIDIPIAYYLQKEIPEDYRGRVLSIGISIGKTMLPLAMVFSGLLLKWLPAYIMPIAGGVLFFLIHMYSTKRANIEISETAVV